VHPTALVLGLGNPGAAYRATRHNLGFWVVERLARSGGARFRLDASSGGLAETTRLALGGRTVLLAKPLTYMNRAGLAAADLCRRYAVAATELTVVHDDADLELGRLRVRRGGRPGGHNGVRSLIEELGTDDFLRVRLGVRGAGRDSGELADYVLAAFEADEVPLAEELALRGCEAVVSLLRDGLTPTMNRYNAARTAGGGGQVTTE